MQRSRRSRGHHYIGSSDKEGGLLESHVLLEHEVGWARNSTMSTQVLVGLEGLSLKLWWPMFKERDTTITTHGKTFRSVLTTLGQLILVEWALQFRKERFVQRALSSVKFVIG